MEQTLNLIYNLEKSRDSCASDLIDIVIEQFGSNSRSELDKWYTIEENCWIKRIDISIYLCVQTIPLLNDTSICYLYRIDLSEVTTEYILNCCQNLVYSVNMEKPDLGFVYPIAISLGIEKTMEKYIALNEEYKYQWLSKVGINKSKELNLYTCQVCKYTFENDKLMDNCPDCGKQEIREATTAECECYIRYQKEIGSESY